MKCVLIHFLRINRLMNQSIESFTSLNTCASYTTFFCRCFCSIDFGAVRRRSGHRGHCMNDVLILNLFPVL